MKAPPAFQFYAADYLADEQVQLMSLEEEGVYIRLLAYCWREGSIPADPAKLSAMCKGASATLITVVKGCFNQHPERADRMVHLRLEVERQKQARWREKSAEGGKKSRRGPPKSLPNEPDSTDKGGLTTVKAKSGQNNKGGATLQSSSSNKEIPLPTASPPVERKPRLVTKHETALSTLEEPQRAIIVAWQDTCRGYPPIETWPTILERLEKDFDAVRFKRCAGAYLAYYGKGQRYIGGVCDWYDENLTAPRTNNGTDQKHPQAYGKPPVTRDFSKYPARTD